MRTPSVKEEEVETSPHLLAILTSCRHLVQESSLLTVDFLTESYMTGLQNHFINLKFKNRLIIIPDLLGKMIHKAPRRTFAKWAK